MIERSKTPSRPAIALGLIKNLGERLVSDERAPYERNDHDEAVDFDEPTGDVIAGMAAPTAAVLHPGTEP